MLPQVIKRNGQLEKFSLINIAKVAVAAGLTAEQGKHIAESLSAWAESLNKPQITSLEVRDKMIDKLAEISEHAAELYKWYEQSKEL